MKGKLWRRGSDGAKLRPTCLGESSTLPRLVSTQTALGHCYPSVLQRSSGWKHYKPEAGIGWQPLCLIRSRFLKHMVPLDKTPRAWRGNVVFPAYEKWSWSTCQFVSFSFELLLLHYGELLWRQTAVWIAFQSVCFPYSLSHSHACVIVGQSVTHVQNHLTATCSQPQRCQWPQAHEMLWLKYSDKRQFNKVSISYSQGSIFIGET